MSCSLKAKEALVPTAAVLLGVNLSLPATMSAADITWLAVTATSELPLFHVKLPVLAALSEREPLLELFRTRPLLPLIMPLKATVPLELLVSSSGEPPALLLVIVELKLAPPELWLPSMTRVLASVRILIGAFEETEPPPLIKKPKLVRFEELVLAMTTPAEPFDAVIPPDQPEDAGPASV